MRSFSRDAPCRFVRTQRAEEEERVLLGRRVRRVGVHLRHRVASHGVGEDGAHEHRARGPDVERARDESVCVEGSEVALQLLLGVDRSGVGAPDEVRVLRLLAETAVEHVADRVYSGSHLACPDTQFARRVYGDVWKSIREGTSAARGDRLVDERVLAPELAEDGDFVDTGLECDAACGGAAVPVSGVDGHRSAEQLLASFHPAKSNDSAVISASGCLLAPDVCWGTRGALPSYPDRELLWAGDDHDARGHTVVSRTVKGFRMQVTSATFSGVPAISSDGSLFSRRFQPATAIARARRPTACCSNFSPSELALGTARIRRERSVGLRHGWRLMASLALFPGLAACSNASGVGPEVGAEASGVYVLDSIDGVRLPAAAPGGAGDPSCPTMITDGVLVLRPQTVDALPLYDLAVFARPACDSVRFPNPRPAVSEIGNWSRVGTSLRFTSRSSATSLGAIETSGSAIRITSTFVGRTYAFHRVRPYRAAASYVSISIVDESGRVVDGARVSSRTSDGIVECCGLSGSGSALLIMGPPGSGSVRVWVDPPAGYSIAPAQSNPIDVHTTAGQTTSAVIRLAARSAP